MKRFSGLPASPAILFPLLHPATWPFGLPLPQDGCKHPGGTPLCSDKKDKDRQRQTVIPVIAYLGIAVWEAILM